MSIITTDQADHSLIANLVDGLEVLQVGFHQGFDTAEIARASVRVVCVGQQPGVNVPGYQNPYTGWLAIMKFYGVTDRVFFMPGEPGEVVRAFVPGQFDVAILDPSAFELRLPYLLIDNLLRVARKVIIMEATGWDVAGMTAQVEVGICQVQQCGHLWVIDHAPVTETSEREAED